MGYVEIIGFVSGLLTTLAFVPQLIKVLKTKSTHDLSGGYIEMVALGTFLWSVYGYLIYSIPLIAANIVTCSLATSILILKFKYK